MLKLHIYFNRINKTCFSDRLKPCSVVFKKLPKGLFGCFNATYNRKLRPEIVIAKLKMSEIDIIRILIHEMCHMEEWSMGMKHMKTHSKRFLTKVIFKEIDYSRQYGIRLHKLMIQDEI